MKHGYDGSTSRLAPVAFYALVVLALATSLAVTRLTDDSGGWSKWGWRVVGVLTGMCAVNVLGDRTWRPWLRRRTQRRLKPASPDEK